MIFKSAAMFLVNFGMIFLTLPFCDAAAPAGAKLNYYGGPVIANVQVIPIFYGQASYSSQIVQFYQGVTNSPYFDWLSEYNTNTAKIGRGTGYNGIFITSNLKKTLADATDVQNLIKSLVSTKKITPNANTYYPIHFAPGISISLGSDKSCVQFCAYHGTVNLGGGKYVYYGVIPDQGGSCKGGCGNSPTVFQNLCAVSSHELIEAVTDPAVGLAYSYGPPLSWYDPNYGEITDICNNMQGTIRGGNGITYTVSKQFSNQLKDCIITKAASGPSTKTTTIPAKSTPSSTVKPVNARKSRETSIPEVSSNSIQFESNLGGHFVG